MIISVKKIIVASLLVSASLLGQHTHADTLSTQKQATETQLQELTHKIKQESAKEHVKMVMTGSKKDINTQLDLRAQRLNVQAKLETLSKEITADQQKQAEKTAAEKAKADAEKATTEKSKTEQPAVSQTTPTTSSPSVQEAFDQLCNDYHLTQEQKNMWAFIIDHESGWNPTDQNASSGAYGLGQALPASKMAPYGDDYMTNPKTQLKWMYAYMQDRYQGIEGAYNFWLAHNWY